MNKKYTVIATVIILAIAGGIYAWQKTQDPYKGWKTYRNDEVGYSIKYPADFAVKKHELTDVDQENNPRLVEIQIESLGFTEEKRHLIFFLRVLNNPPELSPREWIRWAWEDDVLNKEVAEYYKDRIINSMKAIVAGSGIENEESLGISVKLTKNKNAFELTFSGSPEPKDQDELLFNQFVRSLKID